MGRRSLLDTVFLAYFVMHIPITLLIDAHALVSDRSVFPQATVDVVDWYIREFGDFLMAKPPLWFQALVWSEMLIQLPFFFVAVYAFAKCRNWIRIPALMYGVHVVTTMIPILFEVIHTPMDPEHRLKTLSVYLPWFLIPLAITIKMALYPKPFGEPQQAKKGKKRN